MRGLGKTVGPLLMWLVASACQDPPPPPAPLPPISSPIPERAAGVLRPAADTDQPLPPPAQIPSPAQLLDGPIPRRFATPGAVRWTVELDAPITSMLWSPLSGLAVSSGPEVHNVTSWGQDRWRFVAGEGHRLFVAGDQEVVWSPRFERISEIRRWGRQGWHRKWAGDLVGDGTGGFYLVDAATVSAIGPDGQDRWRASLEGLRRLEGPFPCAEGMLFHGIRGLEGVAVTISKRGAVMRETALERGALVLGAGPACEPLVWHGGEVALLDSRGLKQWRHPATRAPIVHRMEGGGFLLATHGADSPVRLTAIHDRGAVAWSSDLPVTGRLTRIGAIAGHNLRARAVGLCLDVSSPCARPGETRGPYNTMLTPGAGARLRVLLRHTKGHLSMIPYGEGGYVVASSTEEQLTELTRRDADERVLWQVSLPGRLSAGPYAGPSEEIYLATCRGWDCGPPHLLIAVTGTEQELPRPAPTPEEDAP